MRWTDADRYRFFAQVLQLLGAVKGSDDGPDRLLALVGNTLLIFGCAAPDHWVEERLADILERCMLPEAKEHLARTGKSKEYLLAALVAEWVAHLVGQA